MTDLAKLRDDLKRWNWLRYHGYSIDSDPVTRDRAADAARAYADLLENSREVEWCERHGLPRSGGLEPVCWVAYMPLFDPDTDLPCRIVSKLLTEVPE